MKTLLTGVLLGCLATQAGARPSPAVVDTCLRTESASSKVRYTLLAADAFQVTEDEDAGKITVTLRYGTDTFGTWEVKNRNNFGLVFNGKETALSQVTRLDQRRPPAAFNPYEAIWGQAREGSQSYLCATFNFEGLGRSGSFQHVRGLYLIERRGTMFYTSGSVAPTE